MKTAMWFLCLLASPLASQANDSESNEIKTKAEDSEEEGGPGLGDLYPPNGNPNGRSASHVPTSEEETEGAEAEGAETEGAEAEPAAAETAVPEQGAPVPTHLAPAVMTAGVDPSLASHDSTAAASQPTTVADDGAPVVPAEMPDSPAVDLDHPPSGDYTTMQNVISEGSPDPL